MLFYIDGSGNPPKRIERHCTTDLETKSLSEILMGIQAYLKEKIIPDCEFFSVGTMFSGIWCENHPPLEPLFLKLGDEVFAAQMLGKIVYDFMVDCPESWFCSKSDFMKREFEVMVYWPRGVDRKGR